MPKMPESEKKEESAESIEEKKEQVKCLFYLLCYGYNIAQPAPVIQQCLTFSVIRR